MGLEVFKDGKLGDRDRILCLCYIEINVCETFDELVEAVKRVGFVFGDKIPGRKKDYPLEVVLKGLEAVRKGEADYKALTRNFGIRQQAMYLKYHGEK